MNCKCEVKLPPIEGECLICRRPVEGRCSCGRDLGEERCACGRTAGEPRDPEDLCPGCGGAVDGVCCEEWCGA